MVLSFMTYEENCACSTVIIQCNVLQYVIIHSNVSIEHIILIPNGAFSVTELEIFLNIVVRSSNKAKKVS